MRTLIAIALTATLALSSAAQDGASLLSFVLDEGIPSGTAINPVGWWRLESSSVDSSGNDNDGADTNVNYTGGKFDGAAEMSGDGYIALPTDKGLETIGNVLTLTAWVYVTDNSRHTIFSQGGGANTFHLRVNNYVVNAHNAVVITAAGGSVPQNTWVHVAYTRSGGGDGTHTIYINGQSASLSTDASGDYNTNANDNFIGNREVSEFLNGRVEDVRIYNSVLTQSNIERIYEYGPTANAIEELQ